MLATAGAVVGLLLGPGGMPAGRARVPLAGCRCPLLVRRADHRPGARRAERSTGPLSLADVAPLLALAAAATGVMVLAEGEKRNDTGSVLPGLADGYVMAVALLVIGWVVAFGGEFHRADGHAATFLPVPAASARGPGGARRAAARAHRRVAPCDSCPIVGLMALTFADSLGVGAKLAGDHQGILSSWP